MSEIHNLIISLSLSFLYKNGNINLYLIELLCGLIELVNAEVNRPNSLPPNPSSLLTVLLILLFKTLIPIIHCFLSHNVSAN